ARLLYKINIALLFLVIIALCLNFKVGDFLTRIFTKLEIPTDIDSEELLQLLKTESYNANTTKFNANAQFHLEFISICHINKVPVIMLDPALVQNNVTTSYNLRLGLFNSSLVSYGIKSDDLTQPLMVKLYHALAVNNYNIALLKGVDKKGEHYPYHAFLKTKVSNTTAPSIKQWIHIAIIHHRHGKYYWIGPLLEGNHAKKHPPVKSISFPAAFDSFDVTTSDIPGLYVPSSPSKYLSNLKHSKFIPCNRTRADEFNAASSKQTSKHNVDTTAKKAQQILQATKAVFDEVGMEFWLIGGTLLGWYRQCGFIAHTTDVDVGAWITDLNPELETLLKRKGQPIRLMYHFGKPEDGLEFAVQGFGIKMDICFHYIESNYTWIGGIRSQSLEKLRWLYPANITLCSAELFEDLYLVPCDSLAHIEADYGANWMLPDDKWIWDSSPPNMVEAGKFAESERNKVVQIL
ncbi:unnamed protein product, partial [Owenia fusiformis]